jgi:hypothetical protein
MLRAAQAIDKVDYKHIPCNLSPESEADHHAYCCSAVQSRSEGFDFALVDGKIRLSCMKFVVPLLRPGGLLILDNANRYVPNPSAYGFQTAHEPRAVPRSPQWADVLAGLKSWRMGNFTDGIWDTRVWVKPQ